MKRRDDKLHPDAAAFFAAHSGVELVDLLLCDTNGIFRGKRVRKSAIGKVYEDGLCLPGSLFAADIRGRTIEASGLGYAEGDADRVCWPVPGTLAPIPWGGVAAGGDGEGGSGRMARGRELAARMLGSGGESGRVAHPGRSAQMLLTMHEQDGSPFFADPRQVLGRVLERFAEKGLTPVAAVELEFYVIDRKRRKDGTPQPPLSPITGERESQTQVYGLVELDQYRAFLEDVDRFSKAQGLPADTAVKEYAPGQLEINLHHVPDAQQACDHAVLLKRLIKATAPRHGLEATFMAKPYEGVAGSGLHLHVSLNDASGRNVFAGDGGGAIAEPLAHAIGGLRAAMAESIAFFAPNANSYRRFQPDQFVPLGTSWGFNNRTVAIRIPAGAAHAQRIEHRVAGADANPYLVMAAVLAGMHHGLERRLDPGPPTEGNAYAQPGESLPSNWIDALRAFEAGAVLPGYVGERFARVYAACRNAERLDFERHVSPLEHELYLRMV
jgi:glutamine synthetase